MVSMLSRSNTKPTTASYEAAKNTLRYLKQTKDYGLMFQRQKGNTLRIEAYCDSDYAGSTEDREDRKGKHVRMDDDITMIADNDSDDDNYDDYNDNETIVDTGNNQRVIGQPINTVVKFKAKDRVQIKLKDFNNDGSWYDGTILRCERRSQYDVRFPDDLRAQDQTKDEEESGGAATEMSNGNTDDEAADSIDNDATILHAIKENKYFKRKPTRLKEGLWEQLVIRISTC
eukprot:Pgem_evm1s5060